ncbi:MAG: aminopeptidase P N-terminal domain-containing protein [Bacteroidetes bacterium]|nr:aminopeptidase P N-terminal domain-containing protein [Bacteroidota bacterium]
MTLFGKNRSKLFNKLPNQSLVIINSNDEMPRNGDQLYKFRQNSDLYYLSGINQPKTILTLCPNHPNMNFREILFTTQPNDFFSTWYGHQAEKNEITLISGIKNIMWLEDFEVVLKDLMINSTNIFLSSNEYIKFIPDFPDRNHRFTLELKEKYPLHSYFRFSPLINDLRLIKESEELSTIQKACDITASAFKRVLQNVKPNVYESHVEADISYEFILNGSDGHAYPPIIASGLNACTLHYNKNRDICRDGDLLLLDFGCEYENYASDCSRTIPVNGKFTEHQNSYYQAVLNVYKEIEKKYIIGNTIDILNKECGFLIENELIKLGLLTKKEIENQNSENPLYKKYFMHGVSHFIGLDVHDVGSKQQKLEEGMILTCEPGIYNKEAGIGIRLENDILITKDGPVNLMKNIPIEIEEIEKIMNKR